MWALPSCLTAPPWIHQSYEWQTIIWKFTFYETEWASDEMSEHQNVLPPMGTISHLLFDSLWNADFIRVLIMLGEACCSLSSAHGLRGAWPVADTSEDWRKEKEPRCLTHNGSLLPDSPWFDSPISEKKQNSTLKQIIQENQEFWKVHLTLNNRTWMDDSVDITVIQLHSVP